MDSVFFEIPDSWRWTTLSRLGTLSGGKTPSMHDESNWSSPDINWFSSKDMKQKYLSDSKMKISIKGAQELQIFPAGTLLMVVRSGILKHMLPLCILTHEATINQDLKAFTLFDPKMCEYIYWMLKGLQPIIIQNYTKHVTTVDSLRLDEFFYQMPVPLPPLEEQQRIVDRVNELMPSINEYEEMEKRLVALKEAFPENLRDAVLQAAVLGKLTEQDKRENSSHIVEEIQRTKEQLLSDKIICRDNSCKTQPIDQADDLPEIPNNWTWVRLGSLCSKIGAGSTPAGGSKIYVNSGIKFLREQNVHNSGLVMDGLVFISDEINASMRGSQVQAKDILVNITGASIGRNALVPDDFDLANVNQHVLIVRLIDERLRHYIHLCLQSPFVFNQMMDKQMGDKPGLSATKVANFVIPIPPIEEQQRIVDRLNAILPLCNELAVD